MEIIVTKQNTYPVQLKKWVYDNEWWKNKRKEQKTVKEQQIIYIKSVGSMHFERKEHRILQEQLTRTTE